MPSPQEIKTRTRIDRPRKSHFDKTEFYHEDMIDLDGFDRETPFDDAEISTLDEFESLSKKNKREKRKAVSPSARLSAEKVSKPAAPVLSKKQPKRRRYIDPATCERDYSTDEIEFMNALCEYKRNSGRMFPTCSEILEVLKNLGYEKAAKEGE